MHEFIAKDERTAFLSKGHKLFFIKSGLLFN